VKPSVDRALLGLAVAIVVMVMAACGRSSTVHTSFTVEGMHCEGCSTAITEALEKVDGVESASADHVTGSAEATYRSPSATPEQLAAEIEGLGYTVTAVKTTPVGS
jgi:copper chaperone